MAVDDQADIIKVNPMLRQALRQGTPNHPVVAVELRLPLADAGVEQQRPSGMWHQEGGHHDPLTGQRAPRWPGVVAQWHPPDVIL